MLRVARPPTNCSHENMSFFGSFKVKFGRKRHSSSTQAQAQQQSYQPERISRQDTIGMNNNPGSSSWNPTTNPFLDPASAAQGSEKPYDAPPSYDAAAAAGPSLQPQPVFQSGRNPSPVPSLASVSTPEDKYAFLNTFDTIVVIDDSGSMAGRSWRETRDALRAITPICTSHDADGIDLYFLNHRSRESTPNGKAPGGYYNIRSADQVQQLFEHVRPGGATPTGTRLQHILKPYVASLARRPNNMEEVKPVNVIVITDGCPTDDPEAIIVQHAKKLDRLEAPPYQVGIQFFQVGEEAGASRALRELDDDLAEQGIRDMVDTVTWDAKNSNRKHELTADGILKVVLGAVVRRLDRKTTGRDGSRRRD